ncbi:MAG TPA: DNA-directed RNA polymerase subunit omega [bacterium]|nr:DNA-directed RNA polymerase subunit omega [bacterium]
MHTPPLEELLAKVPARYALVNVVAVRARQLIAGDLPAVETTTRNPVLIAIEELASGRLHLESRRTPVAPKDDPEVVEASAV